MLKEGEQADVHCVAARLRVLSRNELKQRLLDDATLGRRFAATVTLQLEQLLTTLPLARVVRVRPTIRGDDDEIGERQLDFQRRFHLKLSSVEYLRST